MTESVSQFDSIVIGLGKTGVSVADYLLAQGQRIAVVDSRLQPPDIESFVHRYPNVPLYLGAFEQSILSRATRLILSPGVSMREPAIQKAMATGVQLSSDIEIFCQQAKAPIIAVTGSNGKSTVVTLLTSMIEQSGYRAILAGNIGIPVLDILRDDIPDFYVLELSSFQLETLSSLNAIVSLVLNISPDHMDRYESFAEYVATKQRIYAGDGKMVLNRDDSLVADMAKQNRTAIFYGLSEPDENDFGLRTINEEIFLCHGEKELMPASALKHHARYNISNALATLALGHAIGLPMQSMLTALQAFSGLPHRCQWLANIEGVNWFDDSKGTNVGATCAAIEGLGNDQQLILIAGGDGKQADFSPLTKAIKEHVRITILIGKDAGLIDQILAKESQRYFATSMEAAVSTAASLARSGEAVLLSPACASQDMFRDYKHRGEVFGKAVRALTGARK